MSRVTSAITINRPIQVVFAVLTNVENTAKWYPTKVEERWTSEPPTRVGSTRRAVATIGWFRYENDAVVTAYEPPRWAVIKGMSKNAPFEATLAFEPVEGGTRVEVTTEMFLRGPAKLFGGVFMWWYGKSWDQGLVRLKSMMEAGEL